MSFFKLGGMTLSGMFKKPATRKYPRDVREPYERTRGRIDMTDIKACILCGICERNCPALCIEVDKGKETWQYWPYKCIACDSCVRTCPKKVLEMKHEHADVCTKMDSVIYKKPPLSAEELEEKKRKEKERAEKIAAAKAKKAAEANSKDGADTAKEAKADKADKAASENNATGANKQTKTSSTKKESAEN